MAFKHPHPLAGTTWNVTRVKVTTSLGVYIPFVAILLLVLFPSNLMEGISLALLAPFIFISEFLPYPFARTLAPDLADAGRKDHESLRQEATAHAFHQLVSLCILITVLASVSHYLPVGDGLTLRSFTMQFMGSFLVWRAALPFHYIAFKLTPPEPAPAA